MSNTEDIIESTLVFRFDEATYEAAREHPTFYYTLDREPRSAHPFHIYDDIMRQPELVEQTLAAASGVVQGMAQAIVERGTRRMAARPWLSPAFRRLAPKIRRRLLAAARGKR